MRVVSGRKPASGLSATLEMEPFMGENLAQFTGTTDQRGTMEVRAEGSRAPGGLLPPGFYRVLLSPAGESAAKVVRGCEIADDLPSGRQLVFSLDR